MPGVNKTFLLGNLTRKPELRYTPSGTAVSDLRLAVNTLGGRDGKERTDYLTVVAWGKTAEAAATHLDKGSQVHVEGRLQVRDWETKDGQKRTITEVVAERITFLSRPKSAGAPARAEDDPPGPDDSDVPF